jgi:hypothetical protein
VSLLAQIDHFKEALIILNRLPMGTATEFGRVHHCLLLPCKREEDASMHFIFSGSWQVVCTGNLSILGCVVMPCRNLKEQQLA